MLASVRTLCAHISCQLQPTAPGAFIHPALHGATPVSMRSCSRAQAKWSSRELLSPNGTDHQLTLLEIPQLHNAVSQNVLQQLYCIHLYKFYPNIFFLLLKNMLL